MLSSFAFDLSLTVISLLPRASLDNKSNNSSLQDALLLQSVTGHHK